MSDKRIVRDYASIETTGGITFEALTRKYNKKLEELHKQYENIHDVVVTGVSNDYNDGENHEEELEIYFQRNETDAEYKKRLEWQEFFAKANEEKEKMRLKELVEKYPDLTKTYIKDTTNE